MSSAIAEELEPIAIRLRYRRQELGISQTDVARAMRRLGHKWHQVTVGRVEHGERPIRYQEAMDLNTIVPGVIDPPGTVDDSIIRDALVYRRILQVIGERATETVPDSAIPDPERTPAPSLDGMRISGVLDLGEVSGTLKPPAG